jgi:hypothetical protein
MGRVGWAHDRRHKPPTSLMVINIILRACCLSSNFDVGCARPYQMSTSLNYAPKYLPPPPSKKTSHNPEKKRRTRNGRDPTSDRQHPNHGTLYQPQYIILVRRRYSRLWGRGADQQYPRLYSNKRCQRCRACGKAKTTPSKTRFC